MSDRLPADQARRWTDASAPASSSKKEKPDTKFGFVLPPLQDLNSRLAITQMTTKNWSISDDFRVASELQLKHVGLWRFKYEDLGEQETADMLYKHKLIPSSISWIGGYTGANGYLLDDAIEESENVISFANWVNARTVVVATGEQGQHILSHAGRLTADSLSYLGETAGDQGVQLAVLPMSAHSAQGWTFLTSLRKTGELLEKCSHPNVGLCLHSYHALQDRHWKAEVKRLLPFIKIVRLCDGPKPVRPRRQCLPFAGKMHLSALVECLEEAGYRGLYEIDTWSDDVWQATDLEPFRETVDRLHAHFPV